MRVLVLNPPFHPRFSRSQRSPARTKSGNLYYPIWLGYATAMLEQEGHEVTLLDGPAEALALEHICRLAISLQPGLIITDTSTPSILSDLAVCRELRQAVPQAYQVLVGTHASALPEETLRGAPWIDAVARREYDVTLCDLATRLPGEVTEVAGLTHRVGDTIVAADDRQEMTGAELDAIPFVSSVWKRHVSISAYRYSITPHPQVTMVTGRGCPYKCDFCVWPQVLTGHQYRRRSVDNVVEEFLWIGRHLPGVHVFLEDDTLTVDRKRCHRLAEALLQAGNTVKFTANSRADVDLETLQILKASGLRMVCTGFESADDGILETVQKRLKVDQARKFAEDAKRAGVLVHACFMVGNPGETKATLRKTLKLAQQLNPDSAQFFPLMVYPGTRAYDRAVSDGTLVSRDWSHWLTAEGLHNTTVERPGLASSELVRWCDGARRRFYLRPRYLAKKLWQGAIDPAEMKRNLKAATELAGHLIGRG